MTVYLLLAAAPLMVIFLVVRWASHRSSSRVPSISYRRNLPHGSYVVLGTVLISAPLRGNSGDENSYLTVLLCPNGRIQVFCFEERCLERFIVSSEVITEDGPHFG
ncbi:MAG: hypothetical protein JWO58_3345 [Chitinophagaceae bacterium]|nr:hypothetical protein [Chitinophagaceae bacterium]